MTPVLSDQPKQTLTVRADVTGLIPLLERLVDRLDELCELPFSAGDSIESFVSLETDNGSASAGELVIHLKPTDRLLDFAAAVFAIDVER